MAANALQQWLKRLEDTFRSRIVPVDAAIAERWGCLNARRPLPVIDSLLAATALERGLVLVTRNVRDIASTGVTWINPFDD
jgi:predicted nucleic acid-binding protein